MADAPDPHHEWAATLIAATDRPFIVTSAAVAEATHMLKNGPRALVFLEKLVTQMNVEDPLRSQCSPKCADGANAWITPTRARCCSPAGTKAPVVLTTDHRDFSVYRVPFVSPLGEFHG